MARTKRITKRQLKEDQFVTTAFHAADYFQHHKMPIILAAAGGIALIVVVGLFIRFQASSKSAAAALLGQGSQLAQTGNYSEAAFRLTSFLEANPRHQKAAFAAVLAGDSYFYTARYDEALRFYNQAVESAENGDPDWFAGKAGLAAVEEVYGDRLRAGGLFTDLAGQTDDETRKAHYQFAAVRCYRTVGAWSEAARVLETLDDEKLDPIDQATLTWQKKEIEMALAREGGAR